MNCSFLFIIIIVIIIIILYDYAETSVISSLVRFCLGCSSSGAYIITFLEVTANTCIYIKKTDIK